MFLFTIFSIFWACTDAEVPEEKKTLDAQAVQEKLQGDLSKAEKANAAQRKEYPEDANAMMGEAYLASVKGNFDKASSLLKQAEAGASDPKALKLRQAIVALKGGADLAEVKAFADASGTNYGVLLCAEIDIINDEDVDDIKGRLEGLKGTDFANIASAYLALLEREDGIDLAIAHAGWALGRNYGVVLSNFRLGAEILDPTNQDDAQMLLLWAGRALQENSYELAESWLKKIPKQSGLLEERRVATQAILDCVSNPSTSVCNKVLALKVSSGLKHAAQLTAARSVLKNNPDIAKLLLQDTQGATAAYYWYQLGDTTMAEKVAGDSNIIEYLE